MALLPKPDSHANPQSIDQFSRKMIPYSRHTLSDSYTLSQTIPLENHILHSGAFLYTPVMEIAIVKSECVMVNLFM